MTVLDADARGLNQPPGRSLKQRLDALERANATRVARAQFRREINAGMHSFEAVLIDPPACIETAKVFDILLAARGFGRVRVTKVLSRAQISPVKTIGGLTVRQRGELLTQLSRFARRYER